MSKYRNSHFRFGTDGRTLSDKRLIDSSGYMPIHKRVQMMIAAGREMQGTPQFYDFTGDTPIPANFSLSQFRPLRKPNVDLTDSYSAQSSLSTVISQLGEAQSQAIKKQADEAYRTQIINEYKNSLAAGPAQPPTSDVTVSTS